MSNDQKFHEYAQAALTGILANPKHELLEHASENAVRTTVSIAFSYAQAAIDYDQNKEEV